MLTRHAHAWFKSSLAKGTFVENAEPRPRQVFSGMCCNRYFALKGLSLLTVIVLTAGCSAGAEDKPDVVEQRRLTEPETGSYRWIMDTSAGVRIQLVQRIPDQTRSFYIARGFPKAAADRYAEACVFQTILHNNTKDALVRIDLSDWRVLGNSGARALRLETEWQTQWEELGVSPSARVAFKWSQFPEKQKHRPGDWFQGMIAAQQSPGAEFDLKVRWYENEDMREAVVRGLKCSEDRVVRGNQE